MQLNLKYLFFILLLMSFSQLYAQTQFEIVVSAKELGKRDQVQVEYVILGAEKISGFQVPYFKKWAIINGPSPSSESYEVNGKKSNIFRYVYLLTPTSTGKLELPGAYITADGKTISCKGIFIDVLKQDHVDGAAATPSYAPPQFDISLDGEAFEEDFREYDLKPGEDATQKIRKNLFIKAIASKKKCYVGEPVLVTYKLYTRLKSTSKVAKQPTFTGCSVNEMTTTDLMPATEVVDGKKYKTYVFRRVQLFPLQAGLITTTAATVDNAVTFVIKNSGRDLRQRYYGESSGQDYDLSLSTEPFTIQVMPLPGNKTVTVGKFEIFTRLKKDSIAANETNALIVTVVGSGNFKSVSEPNIEWPKSIYHFDTKETDEIDKLSFPLTGRRTYEMPFEVNAAGKIDIAPVSLSYFDPSIANYKTVQSGPLQLTVTPAIKTNIQQSVMNVKADERISYLLFLLPVAFVIGGLIIWRMPKKNAKPVVVEAKEEPVEEDADVPYNMQEKLDELILIQDDVQFYNKAREFAKDLIGLGKGDQDLLLQVMQDCNTVLYTPISSTSRKEIMEKLQRAI